jgi:hypothetical protein
MCPVQSVMKVAALPPRGEPPAGDGARSRRPSVARLGLEDAAGDVDQG